VQVGLYSKYTHFKCALERLNHPLHGIVVDLLLFCVPTVDCTKCPLFLIGLYNNLNVLLFTALYAFLGAIEA
jgi:hypothetical protein